MSFGARLLHCMRLEGVSHTTLAARTGVDITNVSKLVHNSRKPTLKTMQKILKALPSVDARWLIVGDE